MQKKWQFEYATEVLLFFEESNNKSKRHIENHTYGWVSNHFQNNFQRQFRCVRVLIATDMIRVVLSNSQKKKFEIIAHAITGKEATWDILRRIIFVFMRSFFQQPEFKAYIKTSNQWALLLVMRNKLFNTNLCVLIS